MTIEEAKFVIEQCRGWNTAQIGLNDKEEAILKAKRIALIRAWEVLGREGI